MQKTQIKDDVTGRYHCDRSRRDTLIPPIYSNARSTNEHANQYFEAYAQGTLIPKQELPPETKNQVQAFIDILNLNHQVLKNKRKKYLDGYLAAFADIPDHQRNIFWKLKYERVLNNPKHEFREFLPIYLWRKLRR